MAVPEDQNELTTQPSAQPLQQPFAGRIGGNQEFILQPTNADDLATLKRLPDASPFISLQNIFSVRGFFEQDLWKAAFMEGVGTLLLVWFSVWMAAHPVPSSPPAPSPTSGIYATTTFLGPLIGGITNIIVLSIFIYCLGPVSGAHLNPTISMATFMARLTSFPRMVLYVAFQIAGASIAGLLVRASYGSRNFAAGGCSIDSNLVPTQEAFVIELMADLTVIFMAFGVGLDPRQRETFGPALGPVLVGLVVGLLSFGTAITRPGYYGASMNPARCFGTYIGSSFPSYHWIHWVGPVIASIAHGGLYWALPPWKYDQPNRNEISPG